MILDNRPRNNCANFQLLGVFRFLSLAQKDDVQERDLKFQFAM